MISLLPSTSFLFVLTLMVYTAFLVIRKRRRRRRGVPMEQTGVDEGCWRWRPRSKVKLTKSLARFLFVQAPSPIEIECLEQVRKI